MIENVTKPWKPWKPVSIKNSDPKIPSFIEKGATLYSKAWIKVKMAPYAMVQYKELSVVLCSPVKIALWQHVIVTPEDNKMTVFQRGKPHGSKVKIPLAGHIQPMPAAGAKVQWKNAQKKLKKNITSEAINNAIPNRTPSWTLNVWCPSKVDSIIISENQRNK